jgi:EAL domain-containing protein (putative c-di-GMP-specific phosphodiesterase class I)
MVTYLALISKNTQHNQIEQIVQNLKKEIYELCLKYGLSSAAHIGVVPFNPISTVDDILNAANQAYTKALELGENAAYIQPKEDLDKEILRWKNIVSNIIDRHTFSLSYINQCVSMDLSNRVLLEEVLTSVVDDENKTIPIGVFISIAKLANKVIDFDKAIIQEVIKHIHLNNISHNIMVNLTVDSLSDVSFKIWLKNILLENKTIANKIAFSLTAYASVKNPKAFKEFIGLIHQGGAKIILKRFETKFIPLENIKDYKLDFIKLDKSYTIDILSNRSKQSFIESICELSKLINIKVFSEPVANSEEFNKLKGLGMYSSSIKKVLKFEGELNQGVISYCMNEIENNILNMGIMAKIATISVELLQNMLHYSKDKEIGSREIKPFGSIEITNDQNYNYTIISTNILSIDDKSKIEPTMQEISTLDNSAIRKRYRELRKSGENTHSKGGGIGFFEIAKAASSIKYNFKQINSEKYTFEFIVYIKNKKDK